jgi:hypothetical protein
MTWYSLHVAYHDDPDGLLLDGVRPLFDQLGAGGHAAYFTRHWRRGPHLRLDVRTGTEAFYDVVLPAARRIVGGRLATHPSTTTLDPFDLLDQHRRLARLEADDGPLLPWYPNNSIHVAPYETRRDVLGSDEAVDLLTDFQLATTDHAFAAAEHVRAGGQRLRIAFDLMIATAHVLCGRSLVDGFASFRSHAEGFLCGFPEGPALRPAWDRHFRAHADDLVARVRTIVSTLDGAEPGTVPLVATWVATMRPVRNRAAALVDAGRLPMDDPAPGRYDPGLAPLAETSPFHQALQTDAAFWRDLQAAGWFRTYRFVLNCLYLHLTRLGVRPVERFLLCHLAAGAVEQAYGVSALDAVRGA